MKKVLIKREVSSNGVNTSFQVENGKVETVETIIKNIESNVDVYYTRDGKDEIIVKVVILTDKTKDLRSSAEDSIKNNLNYLPVMLIYHLRRNFGKSVIIDERIPLTQELIDELMGVDCRPIRSKRRKK